MKTRRDAMNVRSGIAPDGTMVRWLAPLTDEALRKMSELDRKRLGSWRLVRLIPDTSSFGPNLCSVVEVDTGLAYPVSIFGLVEPLDVRLGERS